MNTIARLFWFLLCISLLTITAIAQEKKPEKEDEKNVMVAKTIPYKTELETNDELRIPIDNEKIGRVKVVIHNLLDEETSFWWTAFFTGRQ